MYSEVEFGSTVISFRIAWSARSTLGISVLPSGDVEVTAPEGADIEKIKEKDTKRGFWIIEQKRKFQQYPLPQPTKQIISGESLWFLGRQYRIKLFASNYNGVHLIGDRLLLNSMDPEDYELRRHVLNKWYLEQGEQLFLKRFIALTQAIKAEGLSLRVKKLKKTWGEFYPATNSIVLNADLITAPIHCIDYVIVHEITHAKHLNHDELFYATLVKRCPNWKAHKEQLEMFSDGLNF